MYDFKNGYITENYFLVVEAGRNKVIKTWLGIFAIRWSRNSILH